MFVCDNGRLLRKETVGGGVEQNENVDFGLEISIFPPFLRHLNAGFSDKMNFNVEMGYVHASGNW